MANQEASGTRAADIELPPSMANVADTESFEVRDGILKLLAYARRRYARLCELTQRPHKHSSNRLAEKAELEVALKPFGVDATCSHGEVEPPPGNEAFTRDGRFISGTGFGGERR